VQRIALGCAFAIVAPATLWGAGQRPQPLGAMLLSGALAIGVYYAIILTAQRARARAYELAQRADDAPALRKAFERVLEMYANDHRPRAAQMRALHEAGVLAREHRFREAASCLERVDVTRASAAEATSHAGIRAFVIAHLGDEATALELLDETIRQTTDEAQHGALLGTRGIVLQRLGRDEEARELLSVRHEQGPRAAAFFYLGEAERALGRIDEAIAAYQSVLGLPGDSGWHRSAREALNALQTPAPFR
jgi:tetratricopeptide (TPR) repeat protein